LLSHLSYLQDWRLRNNGSIASMGRGFLFSLKPPDRLSILHSLLFIG
jgi:hypothetical protein